MIQTTALPLSGLLLLQPQVFTDERGYFFEVNRKRNNNHTLRSGCCSV